MIGYLSYSQFAILSIAAVALLYVFIRVMAGAYDHLQKTAEQEDEECRGVAAHAFHWNGVSTQDDLDAEVPFALDTVEDRDDFLRSRGVGQ